MLELLFYSGGGTVSELVVSECLIPIFPFPCHSSTAVENAQAISGSPPCKRHHPRACAVRSKYSNYCGNE